MEGLTLSAKFCVELWVIYDLTHQVPSHFFGENSEWKRKSMALNFFEYLHPSST